MTMVFLVLNPIADISRFEPVEKKKSSSKFSMAKLKESIVPLFVPTIILSFIIAIEVKKLSMTSFVSGIGLLTSSYFEPFWIS